MIIGGEKEEEEKTAKYIQVEKRFEGGPGKSLKIKSQR